MESGVACTILMRHWPSIRRRLAHWPMWLVRRSPRTVVVTETMALMLA